ncbi:MAG: hypothetical protein U0840_14585 [Gemmataceae bacterium]
MQTVNFQCGHCGSLMAVSLEYLGRQVRCPSCQQVVLAPASNSPPVTTPPESEVIPPPDSAPPPTPELQFPALEQAEDIFHIPGETEDALFASENEAPRLDMPQQPAPTPGLEPTYFDAPPDLSAPEPHSTPALHSALAESAPHTENGTGGLPWSPVGPLPDAAAESPVAPEPLSTQSTAQQTAQRIRETASGVNWFIPLVFIPLLLWAILATAAASVLYVRLKAVPPSPFESMPDVDGDTPGVRKQTGARLRIPRELAVAPLPDHLQIKLGDTLRVGDLEVTPRKIERRKISMFAEGAEEKAEPSPHDALVMTLQFRNVAEDYSFTPLDNYFDRWWRPGNDESVPLTLLRAGKETFFGGPAHWFPQRRDQGKRQVREWLEGRKNIDRQGLAPGQTMQTIVATDGWNPAVSSYLFGEDAEGNTRGKPYKGKLYWRVQVRRGLIDWKGRRLPATAVFGVEFTDQDYAARTS